MATDQADSGVTGAHLVVGGFPAGSGAGHDMDYVRLRLLQGLAKHENVRTSVANDFDRLDTWLGVSSFLVTYTAGPYPNEAENEVLYEWLQAGGRWLGLHGTSGGRAARSGRRRQMVKTSHHDTLGGFFLNHPPIRNFSVNVAEHELTTGVENFDTNDELYFIELTHPEDTTVLLTTELAANPTPDFGFIYDADTALQPDGRTRALGFTRPVGAGAVTYYALGHCHDPATNSQPWVDESVVSDGTTPLTFRGSWENEDFNRLLDNAIDWGCRAS